MFFCYRFISWLTNYRFPHWHLQGTLTDGTVFDSSYERNDPIQFELGSGQVIKGGCSSSIDILMNFVWICQTFIISKNEWNNVLMNYFFIPGWDQGLLGMCIGEKRKLKIPSKLGYGDQGSPPTIPGANFFPYPLYVHTSCCLGWQTSCIYYMMELRRVFYCYLGLCRSNFLVPFHVGKLSIP